MKNQLNILRIYTRNNPSIFSKKDNYQNSFYDFLKGKTNIGQYIQMPNCQYISKKDIQLLTDNIIPLMSEIIWRRTGIESLDPYDHPGEAPPILQSDWEVIHPLMSYILLDEDRASIFKYTNSPLLMEHSPLALSPEYYISIDDLDKDYKHGSLEKARSRLFYLKLNHSDLYCDLISSLKSICIATGFDIKDIDIILNHENGYFNLNFLSNSINANTLEIKDLGLGLQKLVYILVNLLYYKPSIALLNEPDTHMHPSMSQKLIEILPEFLPGTQFIITTHNPILIESVSPSSVIASFKDLNSEYFKFKNMETDVDINRLLKSIGSATKPVVAVEGIIDEKYILKAAELLKKDFILSQIKIITGNGSELDNLWKSTTYIKDKEILFLYDSDRKINPESKRQCHRTCMDYYDDNPIKVGVENLFSQKLISRAIKDDSNFIDIQESKVTTRGVKSSKTKYEINKNEKTNFCNWVIQNATKKDYANFESIFTQIEGYLNLLTK